MLSAIVFFAVGSALAGAAQNMVREFKPMFLHSLIRLFILQNMMIAARSTFYSIYLLSVKKLTARSYTGLLLGFISPQIDSLLIILLQVWAVE